MSLALGCGLKTAQLRPRPRRQSGHDVAEHATDLLAPKHAGGTGLHAHAAAYWHDVAADLETQ
eukprot:9527685-Lingulodinium_polyedra.AAC.1